MKTTIEVKLKAFQVPNFVLSESGDKQGSFGVGESPKYALRQIDEYTLEKLCEDFTDSVFKKAGKQRPPRPE